MSAAGPAEVVSLDEYYELLLRVHLLRARAALMQAAVHRVNELNRVTAVLRQEEQIAREVVHRLDATLTEEGRSRMRRMEQEAWQRGLRWPTVDRS